MSKLTHKTLKLKKKTKDVLAKKILLKKKRDKYSDDEPHRENKKKLSLKNYREKVSFESSVKGEGLAFYETLSEKRQVKNAKTNSVATLSILSYNKLSECVGVSYSTLCRWVRDSMLPDPVFYDIRTGRGVYSLKEAEIIITEINTHTKKYVYYRGDHSEVRNRIFKSIDNYRKGV